MKKFYFTIACIFLTTSLLAQSEATVVYIEQYKAIAIQEMKRTGIPASITLAQGILESNSGESLLAKQANNHFGIKCKTDWKGETFYQDDDTKQECFRAYPSAKASYMDHSNFLKNRPNYSPLFLLDPVDDSAWAYGLKKAGYATAPDYSKRLLKIIDDYELAQYNFPELDSEPGDATLSAIPSTPPAPEPKKITKVVATEENVSSIFTTLDKPNGIASNVSSYNSIPTMKGLGSSKNVTPTKKVIKTVAYPSGKFRVNEVPAIWVKEGTAYLEIATTHNIPLYKIFENNEMEIADLVATDRLIFLKAKKKFSHKTIHIVTEGENLYDISQTEGVQLNYLKLYNPGLNISNLKAGEVILLYQKQNNQIIKK